jgi:hypothetical protein
MTRSSVGPWTVLTLTLPIPLILLTLPTLPTLIAGGYASDLLESAGTKVLNLIDQKDSGLPLNIQAEGFEIRAWPKARRGSAITSERTSSLERRSATAATTGVASSQRHTPLTSLISFRPCGPKPGTASMQQRKSFRNWGACLAYIGAAGLLSLGETMSWKICLDLIDLHSERELYNSGPRSPSPAVGPSLTSNHEADSVLMSATKIITDIPIGQRVFQVQTAAQVLPGQVIITHVPATQAAMFCEMIDMAWALSCAASISGAAEVVENGWGQW